MIYYQLYRLKDLEGRRGINFRRGNKIKIWPEKSIFPMQLQMPSVTSNLVWMNTPPSYCYSWRILWLFLLFCCELLGDSTEDLPAKQQDPREMKVFLTPNVTKGLKRRSPSYPPPPPQRQQRSDCYLLLDQSKETAEEGLTVGYQ